MAKIQVQVMYPKGGKFDWDYYLSVHMPMVGRDMDLLNWSVLSGIEDGVPSTYVAIAVLQFADRDTFLKSFGAVGPQLQADIPNYTDVTPTIQVSEIRASS